MADERYLKGKTIQVIDINDDGLYIIFTDGTMFEYSASNNANSSWNIYPPHKRRILKQAQKEYDEQLEWDYMAHVNPY